MVFRVPAVGRRNLRQIAQYTAQVLVRSRNLHPSCEPTPGPRQGLPWTQAGGACDSLARPLLQIGSDVSEGDSWSSNSITAADLLPHMKTIARISNYSRGVWTYTLAMHCSCTAYASVNQCDGRNSVFGFPFHTGRIQWVMASTTM